MRSPKAGWTFFSGGSRERDPWTLYHVLDRPKQDPGTGVYCCECACVLSHVDGTIDLYPSVRVPVSALKGSLRVG